jgi:hypothetical protein
MLTDTGSRSGAPKRTDRDVRRAWVAVALLPVAFVLAMWVGEGLLGALGYESGEAVPAGPALLAAVPALLLLIAPGVGAVYYGHRAYRAGRGDAILPAWIGGASAFVAVAINLLGLLVGR